MGARAPTADSSPSGTACRARRRRRRSLPGLRRWALQAAELAEDEPLTVPTSARRLRVVPRPCGTRGYDDFRIRANRENLGQGLRPQIASTIDLVRMLEASTRARDLERLQRLGRMMEIERVRTRRRGLYIER